MSNELKKRHAEEVCKRIKQRIDTYMEMGASREEAERFAFNNEDTIILSDDESLLKIGEIQRKHKFETVTELFEFLLNNESDDKKQ